MKTPESPLKNSREIRLCALDRALNSSMTYGPQSPTPEEVLATARKFEKYLRTGKTPKPIDPAKDAQ